MFGYININPKELSEENKKLYQAYYCGLCRQLKERAGRKGQLLLNYDMTFLIVLLTGLYEMESAKRDFTCMLHPTKRRVCLTNEATGYAADMNIVLACQNFIDDWKDDHSYAKRAFAGMMDRDYARVRKQYPRQAAAVENAMEQLEKAEKQDTANIDVMAGINGAMLGEIFAWKDDMWAEELRCMGFYMGKFIYLMDAYEDLESDQKKNRYNPLIRLKEEGRRDFDTISRLMLTSMMSECAKSFERLPILVHADILRNILYSGVWSKYEYHRLKKLKKSKE